MTTHEIITTCDYLPVFFNIISANSHMVPSHWHAHVELLLIERGTLYMFCNEMRYTLREGDVFLVNSGDIHDTKTLGNPHYLLLQIPYSLLDQSVPDFDGLRFQDYYPAASMGQEPGFQAICDELYHMKTLFEEKKEGYQFLFTSHLHLLLHMLYTRYSIQQQPAASRRELANAARIREIITYVEDHYAEPLVLSEVARRFALNPEYFCRYFKKNTGVSFFKHVNTVRLTHIYQDLLSTDETIIRLQQLHGFTNSKKFTLMFKETYGCKPSVLRKARRLREAAPDQKGQSR